MKFEMCNIIDRTIRTAYYLGRYRNYLDKIKKPAIRHKSTINFRKTPRKFQNVFKSVIRDISTANNFYQKPFRLPCQEKSCLILGVHVNDLDPFTQRFTLTRTAERFDEIVGHRLSHQINLALPAPRLGDGKVFYGLHDRFVAIAVVGVGDPCLGYNEMEQIDEKKEAIRTAVGVGVRLLNKVDIPQVCVESFDHAESAAEGASMASWMYQELKAPNKRKTIKKLLLYDSCDNAGWKIGLYKAAAQNFTRLLSETPSNNLTPSMFAQTTLEMLSKYGINVNVRMKNWATLRNLNGFLTVGKGSCEQPVFLEMLYEGCGPDVDPIVLIGKGLTFDTGGLCLRKRKDLKHARGDMFGAAAVVSTFRAIASLQLPINVVGLLPLCVNSIGASAFKQGDIIGTYNKKTIMIEDTDCEGILMLADILAYASEHSPKFILDIGTLTPDLFGAFGNTACGVWSNNDSLYELFRIASIHTGDRIFRYPLWDYYRQYITNAKLADYTNKTPAFTGGGASKAAAFLQEFVPQNTSWIHIDTYNTNITDGKEFTYLRKGMSGRYTRTLIEFLALLSCGETKTRY